MLTLWSAAAPARPSGLTPAGDVADLSTRICFAAASGQLSLQFGNVAEEIRAIEAQGLVHGIPGGVLERLGRAGQTMLNQATLASRPNGAHQLIVAVGGRMPGCRVILAGAPGIATVDEVTRELSASAAGWTYAPAMTTVRGAVERRSFFRRDGLARPYLLDLFVIANGEFDFRMMANVSDVPQGVSLPPGF